MPLNGYATPDGTEKYAERFPHAATGHFRHARDISCSSIGIGTYLGQPTEEFDQRYTESLCRLRKPSDESDAVDQLHGATVQRQVDQMSSHAFADMH